MLSAGKRRRIDCDGCDGRWPRQLICQTSLLAPTTANELLVRICLQFGIATGRCHTLHLHQLASRFTNLALSFHGICQWSSEEPACSAHFISPSCSLLTSHSQSLPESFKLMPRPGHTRARVLYIAPVLAMVLLFPFFVASVHFTLALDAAHSTIPRLEELERAYTVRTSPSILIPLLITSPTGILLGPGMLSSWAQASSLPSCTSFPITTIASLSRSPHSSSSFSTSRCSSLCAHPPCSVMHCTRRYVIPPVIAIIACHARTRPDFSVKRIFYRYSRCSQIWSLMIAHPAQSLFIGCFPMGAATLINAALVRLNTLIAHQHVFISPASS